MTRPEPTWVYHFTSFEHLRAIIEHGLVSDTRAHRPGLLTTEIGDLGITEGRAHCQVPVGVGGVVADYVPLSYAPRSPMMFSISRGHVSGESGGRLSALSTTAYPGKDSWRLPPGPRPSSPRQLGS